MTLLSRIYFNAVYGALGGLLGWLLFGVFGEKLVGGQLPAADADGSGLPLEREFLYQRILGLALNREQANWVLGGFLIGGMIGFFVVSVEAIRDQSLMRFARLATYGFILGAIGGAIGIVFAEYIHYLAVRIAGSSFVVEILARGLAWSLLGVAIGMSEGIAARSLGKFSYGTLGGAIGGFVGGCLFMIFYEITLRSGSTTYLGNALGLVIMGACIGSLSALVQAVFQPACVKVLRGWQEGREYPLDKALSLLGRDEHADIALFRDMKVEKKHAFIKRDQAHYVLVNNGAPAEFTLVNDLPVAQTKELQEGDRIQLGNVLLRFHMRSAANRNRERRRAGG